MSQGIRSAILPADNRVAIKSRTINVLVVPVIMAAIIFFVTALAGVWAAPDRAVALGRLVLILVGLIIVGGVGWGGKRNTRTSLGVIGLICGVLASVAAIHFLLTVNWAEAGPARFPFIQQIGLWIHNHSLTLSQLPNLHKNLTGGVIVILFPLSLMGPVWIWSKRSKLGLAFSAILIIAALIGLVMSVSRGAWLGFAVGLGYSAYFYWRLGPGAGSRLRRPGDILLVGSILFFVYGFWLVLTVPEYRDQLAIAAGNSTVSRADLWQDSLALIQDYPFTGSGLGSTTMVYSTYIYLLHVPFLAHSHNLFLQIAIEQGLPGLIAFISLVVFTIWGLAYAYQQGNLQIRLYCVFALASLIGQLAHGIVEAGIYAHQLVPFMFLPFGVALALLLSTDQTVAVSEPDRQRMQRIALWGSIAPTLLILSLFIWPGSMAKIQANLGAVAQSRAELAVYHWPEWPLQDELRRQQAVDLSAAIGHYQTALAIDPANVTAHRRLGQIELSLGNYEAARKHLETSYLMAPDQRATRQMLGELDAIAGESNKAVELWQPVDLKQGQLDIRVWWYSHIGANREANLLKQAMAQLQQVEQ